MTLLCIGAIAASYAITDMSNKDVDIKNITMLIGGIAVVIFASHCVVESAKYYNKKEFTTSVPAQIDTTVTIKNGVADTLYTYHSTKEE